VRLEGGEKKNISFRVGRKMCEDVSEIPAEERGWQRLI
jgi:hypothetical protein